MKEEKNSKYNFKFSIIIPFYNSAKYLSKTIDSIIQQDIGFEKNVQLILVNDGSEDDSENIALEYQEKFPKNIIVFSQEHKGILHARNLGLHYAQGEFINFLDSDDYLSINTMYEVERFFEKHYEETDIVTMPIFYFERDESADLLNYRFNSTRVVDLCKEPNMPLNSLSSLFLKSSAIKDNFNVETNYSEDFLFLYQILLQKNSIGLLKLSSYYFRKRNTFDAVSDINHFKKEFYTDSLKSELNLINHFKNKNGEIPKVLQYFLIYDLKKIFKPKECFMCDNEEEENLLFDSLKKILSYIDDETILKNRNINESEKLFLYNLTKEIYYEVRNDDILLNIGDITVDRLKNGEILIENIEFEDNVLIIYGLFESFFKKENINIQAVVETENEIKTYDAENVQNTSKATKYLSKTVKVNKNYNFNIKIPIELKNSRIKIKTKFINCEEGKPNKNFVITEKQIKFNKDLNSFYENEDEYITSGLLNLNFKDNEFLISRNFNFSVVMAIYNTEEYLNEAIDSVINQTIGFEENVQLILVNDGSKDHSEDICLDYQAQYPDNIIVITQENAGQSSARNNGLNYVKGKYVNFLDSDDYLEENALEEVYNFFSANHEKTDLVSIRLVPFGRNDNNHALDYKFNKNRLIDLVKQPNNPQLHVSSSFVKASEIGDVRFPTDLVASEDAYFVNKILLKKKTLGVIKSTSYFYRRRDDLSSTIDTVATKKEYYTARLKNHFIRIINEAKDENGEIPRFLQCTLAYDLVWLINDTDMDIFENNGEKTEFLYYLNYVMNFIHKDVIIYNRNISNNLLKTFLLTFKNKTADVDISQDNVILKTEDFTMDNLKNHYLWLDIVEIKNDTLYISGFLNSLFDIENICIEAVKETKTEPTEVFKGKYVKYTARKDKEFLGETWQFKNNFDIEVPLKSNENSKVNIRVRYINENDKDNEAEAYLSNHFQRHCRLSEESNYIIKDSYILIFKNNTFYILPSTLKNRLYCEKEVRKNLRANKPRFYNEALNFRLLYLALSPFVKFMKRNKKIYLYTDRIDAADDNATHLFKYANSQKDNVINYLILSKDCDDYKKFSKIGKVVTFKSLKHKLLYLFADKLISSHPYESVINPFFEYDRNEDKRFLYNSLSTSEIYFLQHGVTLGNISSWMSKFDHNLSLIVTVSDEERESFFKEGYNFNEDIIQTLGFPRYDNLSKDNSSKQILFIPTWRKYLHGKKEAFLKSDYYENLNKILNNEKLIELTEKYGFEIVFKAHPELEKYINDTDEKYIDLLEINEKIKLSTEERYQELFNKSSIMITDYSSVFFDFAYLKKPLIYYQPTDDYHYDESYFDFETMGFGDIIRNENALIEKIEEYMKNDCKMDEKYDERVDNFFKFTDKNNCKRVYEWIKEN